MFVLSSIYKQTPIDIAQPSEASSHTAIGLEMLGYLSTMVAELGDIKLYD